MKTKLLLGALLAGMLAFTYAMSVHQPLADAAPPKNLKVLPKKLTKKQVKKIMKVWTKALGVDCDFCHDDDKGFDFDTKHKKVARHMLRMVNTINTKYLKKSKHKVKCVTCHRGKKEPPK
jgi:hypothetical protein